jgi:hypothetical protein
MAETRIDAQAIAVELASVAFAGEFRIFDEHENGVRESVFTHIGLVRKWDRALSLPAEYKHSFWKQDVELTVRRFNACERVRAALAAAVTDRALPLSDAVMIQRGFEDSVARHLRA